MTTMERERQAPESVGSPLFKSMVRDWLAELGNDSPGLGVMVTGTEHAVVVFPRAERQPSTIEEYLALTWKHVDAQRKGAGLFFTAEDMAPATVKTLLNSIASGRAVPA